MNRELRACLMLTLVIIFGCLLIEVASANASEINDTNPIVNEMRP